MEQPNQQPKKRSREEMVGGGRSNDGGGRSGGGGRGGGQANSRKKRSKSKKSSNSNETPTWVLDYQKSQKSNNNQNHNVEVRRTRSAAAGGSHNDNSGKKAAANGKSNHNNNNTKDGGSRKGRGSGGGRQIDMQRNANGRGRGGGRNSNGGRGKGGRELWHGGWKPTSRTVSRSSSSDTSVANPLSIQRKKENTKVTTLSWIDPATHYIAIEDEEQMLPTLIHWGKSERGMMKDQPPFRLQKIQNMLSNIQKQRRTTKSTSSPATAATNTSISISLIQSLSYRRNQLKYLNPRLSMEQLRLGNDEDIKGAATQFERSVETYLRKQNIPFLQEWQQKKITRAAGMVNDPPSPDFMLKDGHSVQLSFTSDLSNKKSESSSVVHPLVINWIEAKMFYGASSIPKNTPNAIGCVIPKMESYVSLYGTGAIVFMYGCGSQLAAQLLEVGVVALDGRCLDLTRVEKHQKKWCGNAFGEILF